MEYDLELERVIQMIKDEHIHTVCIQLPEGLKPKAKKITDKIRSSTKANVFIWAGSCFGACDTPDIDGLDIDLLVQWGHSEWSR